MIDPAARSDAEPVRTSLPDHGQPCGGGRQIWLPFAEWVSSMYPKDAAVMYLDGPRHVARFSPESIRLWEQHTRDYVEEVKQKYRPISSVQERWDVGARRA